MRKVSIDVRMLVARAWGVSYANIARSSCDGSLDLTKGDEPDKGEVNLRNMHVIKQERQYTPTLREAFLRPYFTPLQQKYTLNGIQFNVLPLYT